MARAVGDGCGGCCSFVGQRCWVGEAVGYGALETLEFGLLVCGEAWWCWGGLEG